MYHETAIKIFTSGNTKRVKFVLQNLLTHGLISCENCNHFWTLSPLALKTPYFVNLSSAHVGLCLFPAQNYLEVNTSGANWEPIYIFCSHTVHTQPEEFLRKKNTQLFSPVRPSGPCMASPRRAAAPRPHVRRLFAPLHSFFLGCSRARKLNWAPNFLNSLLSVFHKVKVSQTVSYHVSWVACQVQKKAFSIHTKFVTLFCPAFFLSCGDLCRSRVYIHMHPISSICTVHVAIDVLSRSVSKVFSIDAKGGIQGGFPENVELYPVCPLLFLVHSAKQERW